MTVLKILFSCRVDTDRGPFRVLFNPEEGIYRVCFPWNGADTLYPEAPLPWPGLSDDISRYFRGEPVNFNYPLDLAGHSGFRRKVLKAVAAVPYGEVVSYREIARRAGSPLACRAVGGVMAANRLPLLIPCHRVIREDGKPGGFSAGLEWKKYLLELEAATVITPYGFIIL